jgi:adenylate cyclase
MIKILIVDDEEGVRRSLEKLLQRDGYDVFLAENGTQAIDIVRQHVNEIETVICDFKMPGLDGLETLIEIGKINPEIIKIILTGYATLDRAIESVNSGIDGFLTKPFDNKEIRLKLKEFHIKKRLKQFVPAQVLEELQKFGENLEPRNQKVSILFTDIRGFSKISEALTPSELSQLLNLNYFYPLDNIIFKHNGTLDKHIGDGIMGIFGAPITQNGDARRAVACALEMRNKIAEINMEISAGNIKIPVGFGISTGESMVGIFGSAIRKEYTAMGNPVNLAARLERIAKESQILICNDTYDAVKDYFKVEKIRQVKLKGMDEETSVYNVIDVL